MSDATAAQPPEWMQFINFSGRVTGETAQVIKQVAKNLGQSPEQVLAGLLHEAINAREYSDPSRTEANAKVETWVPNEGNGGFHVVTVVADGYGYLVAENSVGEERARVKIQMDDDEAHVADPADDLKRLMDAFNASDANPQG